MEDKKQATAATKDTAKKAAPVKKAQERCLITRFQTECSARKKVMYLAHLIKLSRLKEGLKHEQAWHLYL